MKSSFKKAISAGAKIAQVTFGVPAKVRQKVPTTLQDKGGNSETQEMHQQKNSANNWVCRVESLANLPLSCPTRT
jgi:hypothetical protein